MIRLDNSLRAWGTPDFEAVLKREVAQFGAGQLPLQQGLSSSSSVAGTPITVVVHSVTDLENKIRVKAGIFYEGLVGGCSCAGDPTIDSEIAEYCEVWLNIDKVTAATEVSLVTEQKGG